MPILGKGSRDTKKTAEQSIKAYGEAGWGKNAIPVLKYKYKFSKIVNPFHFPFAVSILAW